MKMIHLKKFRLGLVGALLSAIATSGVFLAISCCAGPLVFVSLGFGFATISKVELLAPYRWIFILVTGFFLTAAFVQLYRRGDPAGCESACTNPSIARVNRILFWVIVALVLTLLIFPFSLERYLLQVK